MKPIRLIVTHLSVSDGALRPLAERFIIEDVDGEPRIRYEDAPVIERDRSVTSAFGDVKVEAA